MKKRKTLIVAGLLSLMLLPAFIDLVLVRIKTPEIVASLLQSDSCVLSIEHMPKEQIASLLIVEDPTFYINKGLDFCTPGAGYTTISQAVGKIIYFDSFTPGIRKIRLMFLTRYAMYPLVSKHDILQLFINYAYLGNYQGKEIRGFEQASHVYYNKPYAQLTHDEYLSLVAMLINPNEYNILHDAHKNKDRVARIQKRIASDCQPANWSDNHLNGCK